jgi:membrane fusion protein, multidrug efflux system
VREVPAERSGMAPGVRRIIVIAVVILVLIALVAGIRYMVYALAHQTTDDAKIDADQVQLTSKIEERVDRILVDTNQYVHKGQLLVQLDDQEERTRYANALATLAAAKEQARAAASTVALTRAQQAAQNQQNAGGVAQAQASIQVANAEFRSSQEQDAVAQAGIEAAQAELRAAQAGVPGALQNLRKAQADLSRTQSLVATGDFSRQQLDASAAAEKSSESAYEQAQQNVGVAEADVASAQQKAAAQAASTNGAQAGIALNQGGLLTAQGRLAESSTPERVAVPRANAEAASSQVATAATQAKIAHDNLTYTQIRSPIDGYVGQKAVDIGQTVSPGLTLMTIVPTNVYITANFKETQMGDIHKGQPVDVNIDAYKGVKFDGIVENISPASQNSFSLVPSQNASGNFVKVTQRVPVRIRFVNPDPKYPLLVGMSVETSVKVK